MKSLFARILPVLTLLCGLFITSYAHAESAEDFVKSRQNELTAILRKPESAANQKEISAVFDRMLDYDKLAKDSLGDQWDKLSADQQKEFQGLLTQLVQRAYKKNLRKTLDYDVSFKGQDAAKKGYLVQTVANHKTDKRSEPISVDYALHQVGGKWLVYDIITEGSSLVGNYKSQFRRIIEKNGFPALIEKMKKKMGE
jgi:phospholipid transport system substrate-binding protein